MRRVKATASATFESLSVRNFRLYFVGQLVSLAGTWMQQVAQAWLVLELTGSGTALGLVVALQYLPVLLLGAWGGVLADRLPKRPMLIATQAAGGGVALVLGWLVAVDAAELWMVYVLAAVLGVVTAVDNPVKQTFVLEMVGPERLGNAVSLNSVMVNLARVVGPGIAGVLIATSGLAVCFLLNATSYVAVIVALVLMRRSELRVTAPPAVRGNLREGLAYVRRTPALLVPLVVMAVVGTLAYEFQVTLPLLAERTFDGGPGTYGSMSALQGAGAVVGGLAVAGRRRTSPTALASASILFGVLVLVVAAAPTLTFALVALVPMGAVSIAFISIANTTLQLTTEASMRGRVMALWSVAMIGSTPIGGPVVGWVGEELGARVAIAIGGFAAIGAGIVAGPVLARVARTGVVRRGAPAFDVGTAGVDAAAGPAVVPAGVEVGVDGDVRLGPLPAGSGVEPVARGSAVVSASGRGRRPRSMRRHRSPRSLAR
jgi:MFS family permease